MIIEDQLDRGSGRIGGVEKLEELNEFAAAVAILDQRVNPAGDKIDPSQQTDCAVALVFVLAGKGRVHAGLWRQIGGGSGNRLDAWLLVVRDDRHRVAWPALRDRRLLQDFHLAINAQYFGHFFREVGVAALQIVAHFVRLHVFLVEDFAYRALHQVGEARMSLGRSTLAGMGGEQPRRPQFVPIAKVLGLATGQIDEPRLGFDRDGRFAAGPRAIIKRCQRAFRHRPLDATLDALVMQPERLPHGKKRGVFPIRQQYPRPLDPARRFGSRLRNRCQLRRIRICERQFNRLRHAAISSIHLSKPFTHI